MVTITKTLLLYGAETPPPAPRLLRAGPLSLIHEPGWLRTIRLGSQEVVRAIYAAVRDHNWNTIEPRFTDYTIEEEAGQFLIRFTADHRSATVDFYWEGLIRGEADGTITFSLNGEARRDFLKNRIGFCVLHPPHLAGMPVQVETPHGLQERRFPERIAPHQPFLEVVALRHAVPGLPGVELELRFEGDLFETEDQRNWSDASFKTYCTPLALPFPVEIRAGQRVQQRITLRLLGEPPAEVAAPASPAVAEIRTGEQREAPRTLPPIGLAFASEEGPLADRERECLRKLQPAHLWLELDLLTAGWRERLATAAAEAQALSLPLLISAVSGARGEGLELLVEELGRLPTAPADLFCFSLSTHTTTRTVAQRARDLLQAAGLPCRLGGGSRANFAEFNRAELPLDLLDVAGYPLNPQVHAFDRRTLVENLAAQAATVSSARAIVGDLPLSIGPITLKPRFNPVATASPAPPLGQLPESVDLRQLSLFAVGWTLGSIRQLAEAGVERLTYYETHGWRGLMESSRPPHRDGPFPALAGALFPLYYLFADLAGWSGATLLPLEGELPLDIAVLALRRGQSLRLLLANLSDQTQTVRLGLPPLRQATIAWLDESNVEQALFAVEDPRLWHAAPLSGGSMQETVQLPPCAYARLDGELQSREESEC
jgi:hypothetical protein